MTELQSALDKIRGASSGDLQSIYDIVDKNLARKGAAAKNVPLRIPGVTVPKVTPTLIENIRKNLPQQGKVSPAPQTVINDLTKTLPKKQRAPLKKAFDIFKKAPGAAGKASRFGALGKFLNRHPGVAALSAIPVGRGIYEAATDPETQDAGDFLARAAENIGPDLGLAPESWKAGKTYMGGMRELYNTPEGPFSLGPDAVPEKDIAAIARIANLKNQRNREMATPKARGGALSQAGSKQQAQRGGSLGTLEGAHEEWLKNQKSFGDTYTGIPAPGGGYVAVESGPTAGKLYAFQGTPKTRTQEVQDRIDTLLKSAEKSIRHDSLRKSLIEDKRERMKKQGYPESSLPTYEPNTDASSYAALANALRATLPKAKDQVSQQKKLSEVWKNLGESVERFGIGSPETMMMMGDVLNVDPERLRAYLESTGATEEEKPGIFSRFIKMVFGGEELPEELTAPQGGIQSPSGTATATNPQTGEVVVFEGGKWVPLK